MKILRRFILPLLLAAAVVPVSGAGADQPAPPAPKTETAVIGGGCFWCVEAVYEKVNGVVSVESGYAGGSVDNPGYEAVCTGDTGHAEVVRITFDPAKVSYADLLSIFRDIHDPTTPDAQGADHGTQYRSIILYSGESQRLAALAWKKEAQLHFTDKVVTQILPLKKFWPAEEYHQHYFAKHPDQPYCAIVIPPKLQKLLKKHGDKVAK